MIYFFYTIHVLICLFLILVVLLQQGKGADLSVFGGGGTMTAFGARGAATLLHKMTVIGFIGFIVTTLVIGIMQKQSSSSSVMTDVPVAEETAPATQDDEDGALPEEADGALPEEDGGDGVLPEAEELDGGISGDEEGAAAGEEDTASGDEGADGGGS